VVLQQGLDGYQGSDDTFIHSWYPTDNFAYSPTLRLRSLNESSLMLRFDVSSIPISATVQSAALSIYVYSCSNANGMPVWAYGLTRPWLVTETTWISATATTPWAVAGADGVPDDRDAVIQDTVEMDSYGRWYDFDLTQLVQGWVRGTTPNRGVILKTGGVGSVNYNFYSSESSIATNRPRLIIMYTLGGTSPGAAPRRADLRRLASGPNSEVSGTPCGQ
jgi:hypothetical protein